MNQAARFPRPFGQNQARVGTVNWGDNFGLVEVDWSLADPEIRLQIREVPGEIRIQQKVSRGTLRPKGPQIR